MMRSNQIWPQGKSNLKNKINEIFLLFTLPFEIIWSLITFNIKQLLKKDYSLENTVCLHSLKFRRQEKLLSARETLTKVSLLLEFCRSEQKRGAIALARARKSHIKNTHVKRRTPKKLYSASPQLLMINLFCALLIHFSSIAFIKCSLCLY